MIASIFATATPASALTIANTEIRAYGKCITEPSGWYGGSLRANDCQNTYSQFWQLTDDGQIKSSNGQHCMKVGYWARMDKCDRWDKDQFFRITLGGEIVSETTRECLSLQSHSFMRFERCDGDGRQRWAFPYLADSNNRCSGGVHETVKIVSNRLGFRISVVTRDIDALDIGWDDMVECAGWFYNQPIFNWDFWTTPGLDNIWNQAGCHATIDPYPFVSAGSSWDYESYNDLSDSVWDWIFTRCGNTQQPPR